MSALQNAKGPAEGATSPSRGPNNPLEEKAMDNHEDTTAPAGSASTSTSRSSREILEKIRPDIIERHRFEELFCDWRRCIDTMGDPRTPDDVLEDYHEGSRANLDFDLARQILTFPTPSGHLCLMRDKLDVLIHHMSTCGEDMDPSERLIFLGVCALRADIVHYGG